MARWRLRFVIPLPGPFSAVRASTGRRHCARADRPASAGIGFMALFGLAWLVSWRYRTRHARRVARPTRWISGWVIATGLALLVVAVLIVI